MLFANPLLLGGIGLIALPIVLHLVMRRQPKLLEFPALRFVRRRHDTNRRRMRLRHWLLLLLRVALIALLALALARPTMKLPGSLGSQEEPVAAALVFDTAPRMDYRQDNRTRLEVARDIATRLIAQLPPESQIAVLDTRAGPAVFQADRGSALQRIGQLETWGNSQPLARVVSEALQLVGQSEQHSRKEVYIFSDLTRGAWPPGYAARLQDRISETHGVGLYVIDVGAEHPLDFALGDITLSAQVLSNRSPLGVETDVRCTGSGGARVVELYLLDKDRKPQRKARQEVTLQPGESRHIRLSAGILDLGTHQGFLRIIGQDGLAADDTRWFTAEVRPAWRVLVAAAQPAAVKALFFTQALAPEPLRRVGQTQFDCDVIPLDKLPGQDLERYAAVCLIDPPPQNAAVWEKLANFAGDGHGVAVFLGRNAQPVEAFNQPAAQEVLAAPLVRQAQRRDGSLYLAPHNYQHPVLGVFREQASNIPWDAFPVFRYWEIGKPARGVNVIVSYNDDRPAVLERPLGLGRAITMTTPVSDRPNQDPWNMLPVGEAWPFVILMNQLMLYAVGSADQQLNYVAGQTAVLSAERFATPRPFVLTTPPPQESKVSLSSDPQRNLLSITATDQPGNYRVQGGGDAAGVDRGFSVNLAPDQTQLERLPVEKLKEIFGPFDYRVVRSEEQLDRAVTSGRVGRELFPLLILLVALLLAAEHFLANRFYREPPEQAASREALAKKYATT